MPYQNYTLWRGKGHFKFQGGHLKDGESGRKGFSLIFSKHKSKILLHMFRGFLIPFSAMVGVLKYLVNQKILTSCPTKNENCILSNFEFNSSAETYSHDDIPIIGRDFGLF